MKRGKRTNNTLRELEILKASIDDGTFESDGYSDAIPDILNDVKELELQRLQELANKCRTENTQRELSSMLRDLDSSLQDLIGDTND